MARRGNGFVYKPARGGPASGPGVGDGWGGPPRGAGNGSERNTFNFENSREATAKRDADRRAGIVSKADIRRQRTEELEGLLYDLAFHAEREETQVGLNGYGVRADGVWMLNGWGYFSSGPG